MFLSLVFFLVAPEKWEAVQVKMPSNLTSPISPGKTEPRMFALLGHALCLMR